MEPVPPSQMLDLLRAWSGGNQEAAAQIIELTWPELHKIAQGCLGKGVDSKE